MLEGLFGSRNIERVLFYLLKNESCYLTALTRDLEVAQTPMHGALDHLEKAGIVAAQKQERTRARQRSKPL